MFFLLLRSASQQVYIGAHNADGAAAPKTWSEKDSTRSNAQQSQCWLIQGKKKFIPFGIEYLRSLYLL